MRNSIPANLAVSFALVVGLHLSAAEAHGLETVNLALTNTNFQMILYPIAQERGYMKEEGIDLRWFSLKRNSACRRRWPAAFIYHGWNHGRC